MDVQWYPGHMTKARRMMEENIRLVDLVIELVDARTPMSSRNPDIDALCRGKGRVVLLCKADLADPVKTEEFLEFFRQQGFLAVAADARERKAGEVVRRYVQDACREKIEKDKARGIIGRPLRAMVAGIPNVGKSTFINSFAGRASTKTGNKPGVTRGKQWIRLGSGIELLDTPGILWPKFDDRTIGMRLALVGAIRDEVLDRQELAVWLLQYLEQEYPGAVREKYLAGSEECGQTTGPEEAGTAEHGQNSGTEETGAGTPEEGSVPGGTGLSEDGVEQKLPEEELSAPGMDHEGISPYFTLLEEIALARRLLRRGGAPDTERAAAMLIDDCRNGRIGRISLDRPQDAPGMLALQKESTGGALTRGGESGAGKKSGSRERSGRQSTASRPASRAQDNRTRPAQNRTDRNRTDRTGTDRNKTDRNKTDRSRTDRNRTDRNRNRKNGRQK